MDRGEGMSPRVRCLSCGWEGRNQAAKPGTLVWPCPRCGGVYAIYADGEAPMTEPMARDRETAREIHGRCPECRNAPQSDIAPPCRVCDAIARALAAERARVESEWRYGHLADSTGHQHTCAKVNGVWACAKGCAQAKLARVLTLTPKEAGRLLVESHANNVPWDSMDEWQQKFYIDVASRFRAALAARAEGA